MGDSEDEFKDCEEGDEAQFHDQPDHTEPLSVEEEESKYFLIQSGKRTRWNII